LRWSAWSGKGRKVTNRCCRWVQLKCRGRGEKKVDDNAQVVPWGRYDKVE